MRYILTIWCLLTSILVANQVAAQGTAPTRPDIQKGEKLYSEGDDARGITACASCHGAGGNAAIDQYPKLAGQHADYLVKQLSDFSAQANGQPAKRENAVMNGMVVNLTPEDMRNIAAYLESQKLTDPAVASQSLESNALGQRIYKAGIAEKGIPACASCHGPGGMGVPSQYPRLSGQFSTYTHAQLEAFREGVRLNNTVMSEISENMNNRELKAISDYISGLREFR